MKPSVCIIGAGSVGVNAALLFKLHDYDVELLESEPGILRGAAQVSFVNHGDGFEYFTPNHRATGEFCVEGSLAKALMYPLDFLATSVCTVDRPLRFLVAESAGVDPEAFKNNARYLDDHYRKMYQRMGEAAGVDEADREQVFVRHPDRFMRILAPENYADVEGIAVGAAGTGFGINMPHYYAAVKAAMRQVGVEPRCNVQVESIKRISEGYEVKTNFGSSRADHIVICSSHHIPALASNIHGVNVRQRPAGTYFLNGMTFLRLPATSDRTRLDMLNRINFTLMEKHGGMFACISPPTATTDGTAAIYYPAVGGSHLAEHSSPPSSKDGPPPSWDDLIANGLLKDDKRALSTFSQAKKLYRFLDGYAEILNTACRPVFNVDTKDSKGGSVRSVREQMMGEPLTEDGRVTAWAAPKWTNAEFTAAMALSTVQARRGIGKKLDLDNPRRGALIAEVFRRNHFRNIRGAKVEDALEYSDASPAPGADKMIIPTAPQFQSN